MSEAQFSKCSVVIIRLAKPFYRSSAKRARSFSNKISLEESIFFQPSLSLLIKSRKRTLNSSKHKDAGAF